MLALARSARGGKCDGYLRRALVRRNGLLCGRSNYLTFGKRREGGLHFFNHTNIARIRI